MANQLTPEKAIARAKVNLILNHPWFGALAMKLVVADGSALGVDTMATDGTYLYYHGPFVQTLTDAELLGVVAHEVMHCAMLHPYRRESRDAKQWNVAADFVINDVLIASGFVLPKGALIDKKFSGLSAEKAYAMLGQSPKSQQPQPCKWGEVKDPPKQGQGKDGKGKDDKGKGKGNGKPDPKDRGQGQGQGTPDPNGNCGQGQGRAPGVQPRTESDWKIDVIQAEKVATAAGKMPGGLGEQLRRARETKTNYREVLKRFMDKTVPVDYSWQNPSRRMLAHGMVLPGMRKENCGELVIGVDTSGSVQDSMLDQFSADIASIIQEYRPSKVHVVYCDTRVFQTAEFEPDGIPFEFEKRVARGGTYFQPVFDWVREKGIQPKACIYLTDLEPGDTPREPDYPVLWGVPETCNRKAWSFGEVVEIAMDNPN